MTDFHLISDFDFYMGFTKELVLNLPDPKDRSIAASWLKKFQEINEKNDKETVHVEYLKLLIIAMHGNNFSKFFEKFPPEGDLEPIDINEIISTIKPVTKSKKKNPFVYSSVSGNLCDFVSIQEIPNFGLQGYYAISTEPLSNWIQSRSLINKKLLNISKKLPNENKVKNIYFEKQMSPTAPATEFIKNSEREIVNESENQIKISKDVHNDDSSSQRREKNKIETRPCWGTNRYIERLIDESPHFTMDLGLTQTDAFLNNLKDRKMKKIIKGNIERPCLLSTKRRQVERMMDLPRCMIDPGEENIRQKSEKTNFTCRPKKKNKININYFDHCVMNDDEDEIEEDFSPFPEFEYKKPRNKNTGSKNRVRYKIPFNQNSYIPDNRQENYHFVEKSVERKFPSSLKERGHPDDDNINQSNRLEFIKPRDPEKSITVSDKMRGSSQSHSNNFYPRHETMGSYGPVSGYFTDDDMINHEDEDYSIRSINFSTLENGERNRGTRRSQEFVSLRNSDENDNDSWENLFSHPNHSNLKTVKRKDTLPSKNQTSRKIKFLNRTSN